MDPAQELVHPGPHRIDPPLGYRSDSGRRLPHLGAEPIANTPAEFAAMIKGETAKWGKIVKDANIQAE